MAILQYRAIHSWWKAAFWLARSSTRSVSRLRQPPAVGGDISSRTSVGGSRAVVRASLSSSSTLTRRAIYAVQLASSAFETSLASQSLS